jgi:hypothetical protein
MKQAIGCVPCGKISSKREISRAGLLDAISGVPVSALHRLNFLRALSHDALLVEIEVGVFAVVVVEEYHEVLEAAA